MKHFEKINAGELEQIKRFMIGSRIRYCHIDKEKENLLDGSCIRNEAKQNNKKTSKGNF